jgi:excisionase family DNA binding protein
MQPQIRLEPYTYSITDVCEITSLGRTTVWGHIAAKRLKAIRIGRRTLVRAIDLQAFLNAAEQEA